MTVAASWAKVWPLLLVLLVAVGAWFWLTDLALHARLKNAVDVAQGPNVADYDQGKAWATALLGLAGTLAGFLGVATAALGTTSEYPVRAEGGMVGILAGATLLDVGGWAVPIALAVMVAGIAVVRVAHALNRPGADPAG